MTEVIEREMGATIQELHALTPIQQEQNDAVKKAADSFSHMEQEMKQMMQELSASTTSIRELGYMQQSLLLTIGNVSAVSEQAAASSAEVSTFNF
jgi:phage tail tape-measure protein